MRGNSEKTEEQKMNQSIAIITARGGSKRIPKKNIKLFCGKPIIQYSIKTALDSGLFSEVMVSTDSEEIAKLSRELGAKVPFFRSVQTSDDISTTSDVVKEVLLTYRNLGQEFDYGCCIYPTAPFITKQLLIQAMKDLIEQNVNTVLPVVVFSFPPQRAMVIRNGWAEMQFPENLNVRSQDLEPVYHDAGQFYAFRTLSFLETGKLIDKKVLPIIRSSLEVQDIDSDEDWKIAEMKYQLMQDWKNRTRVEWK